MIHKSLHVRKPHRINISKAVMLLCDLIDFISDRVPYGRGPVILRKFAREGATVSLWLAWREI